MIDIACADCLERMKYMPDNSVDLILTDIPFDGVNRKGNGLRNLDKGIADVLEIDLDTLLAQLDRICKGTIIIFCGINQISKIFDYFKIKNGTVRQLVWYKSNPSPMNGDYVYLSGIENAIWFKKKGFVFNAHCKNTVFKYPCGKSKIHPTQKNCKLFEELIIDNSNENQVVFDPFMGSGTTGVACVNTNRNFLGIELNKDYFEVAKSRIEEAVKQNELGFNPYQE